MYRLLPVLTGLLLGLAALIPPLSWLALIALWPLFHFATRRGATKAAVIGGAIVAGLVFFACNMAWILVRPPQEWAHVGALTGTVVKFTVWLVICACFSFGFMLFGLFLARARRRLLDWSVLLYLPAAWIVGEALRGLLLSVVVWGPGGSIGPIWNSGALGFVVAPTPLVHAAPLLGLWGLSGLVVLTNLVLWQLLRRRRAAWWLIALIAGLPLLGAVWPRSHGAPLAVSILQLPRPGDDTQKPLQEYLDRRPALKPASILALPEQGDYFQGKPTSAEQDLLKRALKADGLIIGSQTIHRPGRTNTGEITYQSPDGRLIGSQEKQLLVPGGEYLPAVLEILLQLTGGSSQVDAYEVNRHLKRGTTPEKPYRYRGISYGALSCSSIMTPQNYRRLTANGANVLLNQASLLIMSDTPIYLNQNRAMARFHAVANARPFIQASRSGRNYAISDGGKFLVDSPRDGLQIDQATVRPGQGQTLYTRLGEWTFWPALLILLWPFAKRVRRKI